jgi:hypothetical protein
LDSTSVDCRVELPNWRLHLSLMKLRENREMGAVMEVAVKGALARIAKRFPDKTLETDKLVRTYREGLESCGLNSEQAVPCSETLITRILETGTFPRGSLPWEFVALLMINSGAPWTVLDAERIAAPLTFRQGENGLPELVDASGMSCGPWSLDPCLEFDEGTNLLFVCYLPKSIARKVSPKTHLGHLVWMTWAYEFVLEKSFSQT